MICRVAEHCKSNVSNVAPTKTHFVENTVKPNSTVADSPAPEVKSAVTTSSAPSFDNMQPLNTTLQAQSTPPTTPTVGRRIIRR